MPGGAHETFEELAVTTPEAAHATIEAHRRAFARHGVEAAWARVIGLVVQPGVEFDHHQVIDYVRSKAAALSRSIEPVAGMVFEAHSTDYQTPAALEALVQDHFAILKVGPGADLRAARSVLGAVGHRRGTGSDAGRVRSRIRCSRRCSAIPATGSAYYVNPDRQDFDLQYSLSDRIRYYWTAPVVERACAATVGAVSRPRGIPLTLISQYLPVQYAAIREGRLRNDPRELVLDGVEQVLRHYEGACRPRLVAAHDRGRE